MREFFRDGIVTLILIVGLVILWKVAINNQTEKYLEYYFFSKPSTERVDLSLRSAEHSDTYWQNQLMYMDDMSPKDTITLDIAITYFTNCDSLPLPLEYIKNSIKLQSQILYNNQLNIRLNILPINVITGTPRENGESLPIQYKDRVDISKYRYNANYWSEKYYKSGAINCMIYNDDEGSGIGMSYGIPSTLFKIRQSAMHPKYVTFLHELLHCLGLRHTHEYDNSNDLYNFTSGDFIGDTPAVCPLTELVDNNCNLFNNWKEIREAQEKHEMLRSNPLGNLEHLNEVEKKRMIHNVMSYTFKPCRTHITDEQVGKILYTIVTTQDLREATHEYRRESIFVR